MPQLAFLHNRTHDNQDTACWFDTNFACLPHTTSYFGVPSKIGQKNAKYNPMPPPWFEGETISGTELQPHPLTITRGRGSDLMQGADLDSQNMGVVSCKLPSATLWSPNTKYHKCLVEEFVIRTNSGSSDQALTYNLIYASILPELLVQGSNFWEKSFSGAKLMIAAFKL